MNIVRDYSSIIVSASGGCFERMQSFVDACWSALSNHDVSWIGFYLAPGQRMDDGRVVGEEEMLLGPCRNKPACSPIGLHGVCGRGWRERRSIVVSDVRILGAGYVACDPRDQSEVVVPLFDASGVCWGVLDVDSFSLDAFTTKDASRLHGLLHACALTTHGEEPAIVLS